MNARWRLALALLVPFAACGLQWLLWDAFISPYVWFLFFPAAFFSAWLGGFVGGLASVALSALLAWYLFLPPQFSFELRDTASAAQIVAFVAMSLLSVWGLWHVERARRRTQEALEATEVANHNIIRLYERTFELDELKSRFFANVSHELRTPLTLIMAPLEKRLRQTEGAALAPDARQETEMMLRNARLLYRHVSDLLDTAKIDAGGMALNYARLDFAALTRAMAARFDPIARERGIACRVDGPYSLIGEADSEKLQRIVLNLLSNAFKFAPEGGQVALHLSAHDGDVLLEVRDDGPGIPPAMRDAIFERFRQVEDSLGQRHGGTGLGLAIVREFARLHGGEVTVSDAPGGGALFTVRLPQRAPAGTELQDLVDAFDPTVAPLPLDHRIPAPTANAPYPALHAAPLMLVVEDNPDMRSFIVDALRPHYRVAGAADGREGLDSALALGPDLILADVMMPVLGGDAMVRELRRCPEQADVPVVMLTAKDDDALRVAMFEAGVQDYLAKPFEVAELLARVDGLIRARRRASVRLRASENRFEATLEQAAVGIALVAPDGRWLRVNRKLCAIVDYTPEELLSRSFQDITHPADLDADLDYVRRMLAREIDSYSMDKRYLRKDGSIVWVTLTVSLVWGPDDAPDYFISVVEDVSARKAAETELKRRNQELEQFNQAAEERELRMIALKREINALTETLGRPAPYDLSFTGDPASKDAS